MISSSKLSRTIFHPLSMLQLCMSLVRAFSYFNTFLVYISYFKRIRVCTLLILNVSGVDIWLWGRIIRPPGPRPREIGYYWNLDWNFLIFLSPILRSPFFLLLHAHFCVFILMNRIQIWAPKIGNWEGLVGFSHTEPDSLVDWLRLLKVRQWCGSSWRLISQCRDVFVQKSY